MHLSLSLPLTLSLSLCISLCVCICLCACLCTCLCVYLSFCLCFCLWLCFWVSALSASALVLPVAHLHSLRLRLRHAPTHTVDLSPECTPPREAVDVDVHTTDPDAARCPPPAR